MRMQKNPHASNVQKSQKKILRHTTARVSNPSRIRRGALTSVDNQLKQETELVERNN
jgi:hypothetical protein